MLILLGRSWGLPIFTLEVTPVAQSDLHYTVLRSSRRTLSLEIRPDGTVLVRAPGHMSDRAIRDFVNSREAWLRQKLSKYENRPAMPVLTREELAQLRELAGKDMAKRVERYAAQVGVSFGRITIRAQKSRWGSCSGRGNLNFNCLLMLAPEPVRDYVAVHELCHRKQMNHSPCFWAEVRRVLPDYEAHRKWLKENGGALIARIPE